MQLCTLRWRGHFLADTRDLPADVLQVLAPQLGLLPIPLTDYPQDDKTRTAHHERIRQYPGFARCEDTHRQHLLRYLTEAGQSGPRTGALRKAAHQWLLEQRVVRPGRTTLRDLVSMAREARLRQTYDTLTHELIDNHRKQLDSLLTTVESSGRAAADDGAGDKSEPEARSRLERLKVPPHRESPAVLLDLLNRLELIHALGFTEWPALANVHPAARRLLASWGYRYDAWSLRRFQPP